MRVFAIAAVLVALILSPQAVSADIHGIAYGFVRSVTPNFDGAGGCRMLLEYDRFNVIDFPAGDLADACAAAAVGPFSYFEVVVDDASPIPCNPWACSKLSSFSRYTAAGIP